MPPVDAHRTIHGYVLKEILGSGSYGEVYRAIGPGDIHVAVKIIQRNRRAVAELELDALKTIKDLTHPYLLKVVNCFTEPSEVVMVMELADGTLRDRLKYCRSQNQPYLPAAELLHYMRQAADALDYLHHEGKLHRDVKPDNFLLFNGARPYIKVGDCGLVREQRSGNQEMTLQGTPPYIAPEVWGRKGGPASDQYSLAITYVELRRGERPFPDADPYGQMAAHQTLEPDLAKLGAKEKLVVERALAKDPLRRFSSCLEFVEHLEQVLGIQPDSFRPRKKVGMPGKEVGSEPPPPSPPPTDRDGDPPAGNQTYNPGSADDSDERPDTSLLTDQRNRQAERPSQLPTREPKPRRPWVKVALAIGLFLVVGLAAGGLAKFFWPSPNGKANGATNGKNPELKTVGAVTIQLPEEPFWVAAGEDRSVEWAVPEKKNVEQVGLTFDAPPGLHLESKPGKENRIQVSVRAGADVKCGFYKVGIKAAPLDGAVPKLTVQGPDRFEIHVFPAGFAPRGAPVGRGPACYPLLIRSTGGEEVVFRLLSPRPGQTLDPLPFYVMRNKLTNGLFRQFADKHPDIVATSQWRRGGRKSGKDMNNSDQSLFPVLRVQWDEARKCAQWLGGDLPTPEQFDRAAGWPGGEGPGPFKGPKVAVERRSLGPCAVGGADDSDDVTLEDIHGLAGNGQEWTRTLRVFGKEKMAVLRGRSYTAPGPLLYSMLKEQQSDEMTLTQYPHVASPYTGFRVVVEFPTH